MTFPFFATVFAQDGGSQRIRIYLGGVDDHRQFDGVDVLDEAVVHLVKFALDILPFGGVYNVAGVCDFLYCVWLHVDSVVEHEGEYHHRIFNFLIGHAYNVLVVDDVGVCFDVLIVFGAYGVRGFVVSAV